MYESATNVSDQIKKYLKKNPGSPQREYLINLEQIPNFERANVKQFLQNELGDKIQEVTITYYDPPLTLEDIDLGDITNNY